MNNPDHFITRIEFYEVGPRGPVGRGRVTIANAVFFNFSIWENAGSYSVSLPRSENRKFDPSQPPGPENRKYYEEVGCISKETREELVFSIINAFLNEAQATPATVNEHPRLPF